MLNEDIEEFIVEEATSFNGKRKFILNIYQLIGEPD